MSPTHWTRPTKPSPLYPNNRTRHTTPSPPRHHLHHHYPQNQTVNKTLKSVVVPCLRHRIPIPSSSAVVDCCIGIPVYFTDLQRRAVMDATAIAGLQPLRLFHGTTATMPLAEPPRTSASTSAADGRVLVRTLRAPGLPLP
ncbi:uncharacterized protein M6B38_399000 [Iris pallida]|uniref:Uncharacterized protein n=1 Tax=Iris pallida TaxID=29817 RepID=A0AAX6FVD3_IRIPA|nr:uncharacterized protein M6B38_399000 [Iris pallida]